MTPLRQFKGVPAEIIRKAEGKQFVRSGCHLDGHLLISCRSPGIATLIWYVFISTVIEPHASLSLQSPPEIGELIGIQNAGRLVHRLVHSFPKLQ